MEASWSFTDPDLQFSSNGFPHLYSGATLNIEPEIKYTFDADGKVTKQEFKKLPGNFSTSFTYDAKDRLTAIISPPFREKLSYYKNNNISMQKISAFSMPWCPLFYQYQYDNRNRLTAATCSNIDSLSESYTYSPDGSITTRTRNNSVMQYKYPEGKYGIQSVKESGDSINFSYNGLGNFISDGTTTVQFYDWRNMPLQIQVGANNHINYNYDEAGNRIGRFYGNASEYYLRDAGGRELAIFDMGTQRPKQINLYAAELTPPA